MACCGSCAPARPGRICRDATALTRPAIAAFSSGSVRAYWTESCGLYARICWARGQVGAGGEPGRPPRSAGQKGGRLALVQRAAAKGQHMIMAIADSGGLPIASGCERFANESTLVEQTLDRRHIGPLPKRMIGDKAYDSDPLDARLQERVWR